jgi:hypothetical protein
MKKKIPTLKTDKDVGNVAVDQRKLGEKCMALRIRDS